MNEKLDKSWDFFANLKRNDNYKRREVVEGWLSAKMEVVACPSIFTIPFLIQNLNSKKVCDGLTADIMQKQKDNIQF